MASALYTDVKRKGNKSVFTRYTPAGGPVQFLARANPPGAAGVDCCMEREHCMRSAQAPVCRLAHCASIPCHVRGSKLSMPKQPVSSHFMCVAYEPLNLLPSSARE